MRITVIGGGSWGTALAHLMAKKNFDVTMLVRDAALAESITLGHTNERYLPGLPLAPGLKAETEAEKALAGAEICVLATPSQFLRSVLEQVACFIPGGAVPVCASKGIELGSLKRMSQVVADVLPDMAGRYAILSGPSFAVEAVEGKPAAVVIACADIPLGEHLRGVFSSGSFRVYSSTDVVGVEIGGAVKNVMAIAAGLCDGLGLGHNSRAALITRGLAEISRLGMALGARGSTFMGLSGMGDLVLTCTGNLSRNRQVGMRLAAGESMARIAADMHMVAEGVTTTGAVRQLGESLDVALPIVEAMHKVISEGANPVSLVEELMTRALREE